jgi:hypothetical protein
MRFWKKLNNTAKPTSGDELAARVKEAFSNGDLPGAKQMMEEAKLTDIKARCYDEKGRQLPQNLNNAVHVFEKLAPENPAIIKYFNSMYEEEVKALELRYHDGIREMVSHTGEISRHRGEGESPFQTLHSATAFTDILPQHQKAEHLYQAFMKGEMSPENFTEDIHNLQHGMVNCLESYKKCYAKEAIGGASVTAMQSNWVSAVRKVATLHSNGKNNNLNAHSTDVGTLISPLTPWDRERLEGDVEYLTEIRNQQKAAAVQAVKDQATEAVKDFARDAKAEKTSPSPLDALLERMMPKQPPLQLQRILQR